MSPSIKRSPSFSRTATGASKSPVFTNSNTMKTSYAAKRQGDFFAEARASPTPHTYVEYPRSRRPDPACRDPACRRFVYKLWQRSSSPQCARASSLPMTTMTCQRDLIDTSPPPSPGSSASESLLKATANGLRMAIDPGAGRPSMSNSVRDTATQLEILIETLIYSQLRRACAV